jgi:hypothetical protein
LIRASLHAAAPRAALAILAAGVPFQRWLLLLGGDGGRLCRSARLRCRVSVPADSRFCMKIRENVAQNP